MAAVGEVGGAAVGEFTDVAAVPRQVRAGGGISHKKEKVKPEKRPSPMIWYSMGSNSK